MASQHIPDIEIYHVELPGPFVTQILFASLGGAYTGSAVGKRC